MSVLYIYVFESLFPITYGGDDHNPVTGLITLGGLIIYPFYILMVNLFGMASDDKAVKTA